MPNEIRIEVDPRVFNQVYLPYLQCMARIQIFYGGAASGKSVFVAQRVVWDLLNGGRNYLICRAVAKNSRRSTFAEVQKAIGEWGVNKLFNVSKSEMVITCANGYQAMFVGLDDTQKLKSITPAQGAITDIWIEEATQIEPTDIKELIKRQRGGDEGTPKRLTMTFNPIYKTHHLYQEYFSRLAWADSQTEYNTPDLSILKTWYIHNRFLTQADIADLENEQDEYYHNVYALGNWGILGDVIFKNWRTENLLGMQGQFTRHYNGLDFGFSSDPAALVATHYDRANKTIYFYDEFYERGLTNDLLATEVKAKIGNDPVICDSSEPKSIVELRQRGVSAMPAKKGRDSVIFGIQWLQQQSLVIDSRCINTRENFSIYHWKKDKDGNAIRQPVEKNDHAIDAARYAYEGAMISGTGRGT